MTFEDFCRQNNIIIQYHCFTTKIRGLCIRVDDYYIVAINPRFSRGSQLKTLEHEVIHIMENHFDCSCCDVDHCEEETKCLIGDMKLMFE